MVSEEWRVNTIQTESFGWPDGQSEEWRVRTAALPAIGEAYAAIWFSHLTRNSPISHFQEPMMLSILCAWVALIGLMGCAAVRGLRTMTGKPGTEAEATRADLSTEAQATSTEARSAATDPSLATLATRPLKSGSAPGRRRLRPSHPERVWR